MGDLGERSSKFEMVKEITISKGKVYRKKASIRTEKE